MRDDTWKEIFKLVNKQGFCIRSDQDAQEITDRIRQYVEPLQAEKENPMDDRTGVVYEHKDLALKLGVPEKNLKEVETKNLAYIHQERLKKYGFALVSPRGRCPCGSGKRFKSCCMDMEAQKQKGEGK